MSLSFVNPATGGIPSAGGHQYRGDLAGARYTAALTFITGRGSARSIRTSGRRSGLVFALPVPPRRSADRADEGRRAAHHRPNHLQRHDRPQPPSRPSGRVHIQGCLGRSCVPNQAGGCLAAVHAAPANLRAYPATCSIHSPVLRDHLAAAVGAEHDVALETGEPNARREGGSPAGRPGTRRTARRPQARTPPCRRD